MRRALARTPSRLAIALVLAAALGSAPGRLQAQSFNGTGTVVLGAADITSPTLTSTRVGTNSPNVVIDWTPTDTATGGGPINFQTAGTSALFTNQDATTLTVLNRIIPTDPSRPIVFNGTVTSELANLSSGAVTRGGTLLFYSPGGILVSPTGVFNVGNLVLTASDVKYDSVAGTIATSGRYQFQKANAGSRVEVQSGARISAGPTNAFVALVAPKVINSGLINVDGSAVIVAADASTITFNPSGLFDIQIDQGTSATGEVVTNDGTITGPVGTAAAQHRVYFVAVPKNDAITMAIKGGSSLGFDVAGAADVVGNAIVLSAGYDIKGGVIDATRSAASGAFPARLAIGAVNATSQVTGQATGQASLVVGSGEAATFASNVALSGVAEPGATDADAAFISVSGLGSTLDITGNTVVTALDGGQALKGAFSDSGNARISVDRGSLTISGNTRILASRAPDIGVDAVAGNAELNAANGATATFAGGVNLDASAAGTTNSDLSAFGPNSGSAGTARVSVAGGSTISVGGRLSVAARGSGGSGAATGYAGTDGTGGSAVVEGLAGGGTLKVNGPTTLDARGFGGDGLDCTLCTVEGGVGTGGSAGISAGVGSKFSFSRSVLVDASGLGGSAAPSDGRSGADGQGGSAFVRSTGGTVTAGRSLVVSADGTGGNGAFTAAIVSGPSGVGGTGGSGLGGAAAVASGDAGSLGAGGSISITGATTVSALATGGNGGTGGDGVGGTASLSARNGSARGASLTITADAVGGSGNNGGNGGSGTGGAAQINAESALEGGASVRFLGTQVSARGDGGSGSSSLFVTGPGGAGGNGNGGTALALAEAGNGVLSVGNLTLDAGGAGGIGGDGAAFGSIPITGANGRQGGDGVGGTTRVGMLSGLDTGTVNIGSATFASVTASARGNGGTGGVPGAGVVTPGASGNGGRGFGGGAGLVVEGGLVTLGGAGLFDAGGLGGSTGTGGLAGDGFVGTAASVATVSGARLDVRSRTGQPAQKGALQAGALTFLASAETGKRGTAGAATILGAPLGWQVDGGRIDAASLDFLAVGTPAPTALPSNILLVGGNTTLTGDLGFVTPGQVTITLDGADVRSVNAAISASDWVPGAVPAGTAGTLFGSGSVSLTTGGDLFGHLSVDSGAALSLGAAGLVRLDNLTALNGIDVNGGTAVSLGNVTAGDTVSIGAPGNIAVGNVRAGGLAVLGSGAALSTGSVTSGEAVKLSGTASVTAGGTVQAGDSVQLVSDGAINAGSVSAGLVSPSVQPSATYDITVFGKGSLTLGDLSAARNVMLFTPLGVNAGAISGVDMAVLAGQSETLGAITATGRVLLADYAMTSLGGDPLVGYQLDDVLAAAPIAANGAITVGGAITAGALRAQSKSDISLQAVTTTPAGSAIGDVDLQAGGALLAGAINSGGRIDANAGTTMDLASANAANFLSLTASGAVTTGALYGERGLTVAGLGAVKTGTVGSGSASAVAVTAGGAMDLAAVTSGDTVVLDAGGALSAGAINAVGQVTVAGGDSVALGDVSGAGVPGGNGVRVTAGAAPLTVGNVSASEGNLLLNGGGKVTSGTLETSDGLIGVTSGGAMSLSTLTSSDVINLDAGGTITTGGLLSQTGVAVVGTGSAALGKISTGTGTATIKVASGLSTSDVTGYDGISLESTTGGVTTGNLVADNGAITIIGGGAVSAGNLSANLGVSVSANNGLTLGSVFTQVGDLKLSSVGALAAGALGASSGAIRLTSGGNLTLSGPVTADTGDVDVFAAGDLAAQDIAAAGQIGLNAAGAISAGNLASGSTIFVAAPGNVTLGTVSAIDLASLDSGAALAVGGVTTRQAALLNGAASVSLTGDVVAGSSITLSSDGLVSAKGLSAGLVTPSAVSGAVYDATVVGLGGIALGDVAAAHDIKLFSPLAVTAGALSGREIAVLSGGAQSLGSIAATGRVLLADYAMVPIGGNPLDGYDIDKVLSAAPVGAGGAITVAGATIAGALTARSTRGITMHGIDTLGGSSPSGTVNLRAGAALATGAISAGSSVDAVAGGAIKLGAVDAAGDIVLSAGTNLAAGDLASSGGRVLATANGAAGLGNLSAAGQASGTGLRVTAGTSLSAGNASVAAGELRLVSGGAMVAGNLAAAGDIVTVRSGGTLKAGTVNGQGGITLSAAGDAALGNAGSANGTVLLSSTGGGLTAGDVAADTANIAISAKGAISAAKVSAATGFVATTASSLTVNSAATATGDLVFQAGGDLTTGDLTAAAGQIKAQAGGAATLGNLSAAGLAGASGIKVAAVASLTLGNAAAAAGSLDLSSTGALVAADLSGAEDVRVTGLAAVTTGTVQASAGRAALAAKGDLAAGDITAAGAVSVQSTSGNVTAQSISAGGDLTLLASGALRANRLTAAGSLVAGGLDVALGDVSGGDVGLSAGGTLLAGTITADRGDVLATSIGALQSGSITAAGRINLGGAGALATGDLTAGSTALVSRDGAVSVGNVRGGTGTVEVRSSAGSLTAGTITAGTDTALVAATDLVVGDVSARDILLLAGGNVRAAALASSGGRILIASNASAALGGPVGDFQFDPVFAAPLASTGGTLVISGPVSAGTFTSAVAGDTQIAGVTASRGILVDTGAAARLRGVWQSPSIELRASDLDMPAGSGLNAGVSGTITLISRNAAGMRIGDGLGDSAGLGSAFSLDNGEWSRINSGSVGVFGRDGAAAVDIVIGKLDMTGPDAGSTIDDPAGSIRFSTGTALNAAPSGAIRVVGALAATGFRAGNALVFRTGQFQLASDTGSIAVLGKGDTLAGTLRIEASDIHVASTPLLAQLAANPFFAGVEPALDQQSAGGSAPVLSAGGLDFTVGRSFYVQRSGSGIDPLGFEEPLGSIKVRPAGAGPVAVIINGTFRTATGVVSGAAAWRQFKASGADLSGFTFDSRLNGCLLILPACEVRLDPDPGIRPLIDVVRKPVLDDSPDDPGKRDPLVQSAILPPQLILPVQPDALPGQIDEPIAGSGNPALMSGSVMEGARP